jgi:hypothetical protein
VLALYGMHKLMARFVAGEAEQALRISEEFPPLPGLLYVPDWVKAPTTNLQWLPLFEVLITPRVGDEWELPGTG